MPALKRSQKSEPGFPGSPSRIPVGTSSMIRKSGDRFSEKIMLKQ
jgi:hypothetical protein